MPLPAFDRSRGLRKPPKPPPPSVSIQPEHQHHVHEPDGHPLRFTPVPEPTPTILYAVTAALPDEPLRDEYVAWLTGGHVQDVIAAGAIEARVVVLDPEPKPEPKPEPNPDSHAAGENATFRVESVYIFPTRQALETYFRDHAPRLRAQGVARFASRGVTFQRRIGRVAGVFSSRSIAALGSHGASA